MAVLNYQQVEYIKGLIRERLVDPEGVQKEELEMLKGILEGLDKDEFEERTRRDVELLLKFMEDTSVLNEMGLKHGDLLVATVDSSKTLFLDKIHNMGSMDETDRWRTPDLIIDWQLNELDSIDDLIEEVRNGYVVGYLEFNYGFENFSVLMGSTTARSLMGPSIEPEYIIGEFIERLEEWCYSSDKKVLDKNQQEYLKGILENIEHYFVKLWVIDETSLQRSDVNIEFTHSEIDWWWVEDEFQNPDSEIVQICKDQDGVRYQELYIGNIKCFIPYDQYDDLDCEYYQEIIRRWIEKAVEEAKEMDMWLKVPIPIDKGDIRICKKITNN